MSISVTHAAAWVCLPVETVVGEDEVRVWGGDGESAEKACRKGEGTEGAVALVMSVGGRGRGVAAGAAFKLMPLACGGGPVGSAVEEALGAVELGPGSVTGGAITAGGGVGIAGSEVLGPAG